MVRDGSKLSQSLDWVGRVRWHGVEGGRGYAAAAQTSGDLLNAHPHLHGLAPRGGWDGDGAWVSVPYVDPGVAERLFRAKVLAFLKAEGLLSEEREQLLLSWEHATGFSVDSSVKVEPEDGPGLERLARYLLRPPVSLERMHWDPGSDEVAYRRKTRGGQPGAVELLSRSTSSPASSPTSPSQDFTWCATWATTPTCRAGAGSRAETLRSTPHQPATSPTT